MNTARGKEAQVNLNTGDAPSHSANSKGRILIVEDDELSQELLKILLTQHGYSVAQALNGVIALNMCKIEYFDLIIMDLQMPEMDGLTAAKKIHELSSPNAHIPIIGLTASNIPATTTENFKRELDITLGKPFEVKKILQILEAKIEGRSVQTDDETFAPTRAGAMLIVDIQEALPRFGSDEQQYRELFDQFQQSLAERLAAMEECFLATDFDKLGNHAHNIKGVAANLGARQLSFVAAQIDEQCEIQDAEKIFEKLVEIREAIKILQSMAPQIIDEYFTINTADERNK